MPYKYLSYILFTSILCTSCVLFEVRSSRKDFNIADQLVIQYQDQMEKEGFELYVTGGSYRHTIRELTFFYHTQKFHIKSIEAARILIVTKVEQFLAPFNKNTFIRPYLHNFPFTAKNLTLSLGFVDKNRSYLLPPYIARVMSIEGQVYYYRWNASIDNFEVIHKESYDRALSIYTSMKNKNSGQYQSGKLCKLN